MLQRLHRNLESLGPRTSTSAREKAGAWPQLTIPPTAPSRPTEATSAVRPPVKSTIIEIMRRIDREIRVDANLVASSQAPCSPESKSTIVPYRLDERPRFAREGRKEAIAGKCIVGLDEFVGCRFCHVLFPVGRQRIVASLQWTSRSRNNAPRSKLLHQLWTGFDAPRSANKEAIGDEPERRDVDQASPLVDQVDEGAVDIGIFAGSLVRLWFSAVENQLCSAVLEPDGRAVTRFDRDGPFFTLGSTPVEARRGARRQPRGW